MKSVCCYFSFAFFELGGGFVSLPEAEPGQTCKPARARHSPETTMPLIKLNRINKGGEILIHSEHIVYVEVESRTTTLHMTGGLLFSVEESLDVIAEKVEAVETARIRNGIQQSGLSGARS